MRKEIRISGFGGQGVILSGIILTQALGLYENKKVAQTQSYGPESRGGACKSDIVFSDAEIDYMKVDNPDYFLAFNELSYKKYLPVLSKECYILIDQTFIKEVNPEYKNIHKIEATKLAEAKLRGIVANLVMLGAFARTSNVVSYASLEKAVQDIVPPAFYQMNLDALGIGYKEVDKNEML
jgi:2-oxoglutarate ferredoxin oxidoreductase subunit gamma